MLNFKVVFIIIIFSSCPLHHCFCDDTVKGSTMFSFNGFLY